MALSVSGYKSLLDSELASFGYNGPELSTLTDAIATGVITTILTLPGIISSPVLFGPSVGVGIVGFSASGIESLITSTGTSLFGQAGTELPNFGTAIGNATVTHLALATLSSDTNGTAAFPLIAAATSVMKAAIIAAAPTFTGPEWPNFAEAIATGICTEVGSTGIGILTGAILPGTGAGIVLVL